MSSFSITSIAVGGFLASLCLLQACTPAKVKKPTSDTTPPTLIWNVRNEDTGVQGDHPGNYKITVKRGEHYMVTLKAHDGEGVHVIQLGETDLNWQCAAPPDGEQAVSNSSVLLGPPQSKTLEPDSSGNVLTDAYLVVDVDSTGMTCQSTWVFNGGGTSFSGTAANYFGGTTTSTLQFVVVP